MPFDSEGNFSRLHNWEDDRKNDIDIVTDRHDEEDDNFAAGLSECFLKDGRSAMKGDLDAGDFRIKHVATGIQDTDAVNKKQLSVLQESICKVLNAAIKIGDIKASGIQQDHDSWMLCDGRELERSEYSSLFDVIGTSFGVGNDSTTFNIPDCRGVFLRGTDCERGFDEGRELGSYQDDAFQGHFHGSTSNLKTGSNGGGYYSGNLGGQIATITGPITDGENGEPRIASETRPKNIAVNYFIKVAED